MDHLEQLRYPVGRFQRPDTALDAAARARLVDIVGQAPGVFRSLTERLTDAQLERTYRPGGWTIRQVVHHVPDSHMNAYIRMKLAVTEDLPTIKPYDEAKWSLLADNRAAPVGMSLDLLEALHARWVIFLRSLSGDQFARRYTHPEVGVMTVDEALSMYAWHGRHHAAHVRIALGMWV